MRTINLGFGKLIIGREPQGKAALADIQGSRVFSGQDGVGQEWANPKYGEYYATSVPAYRAVKLRADAVASAPLKVYRRRGGDDPEPVPSNHPIQELLDRVNPWWTAADLWKATESYLSLWGSAYWFIDSSESNRTIWPLRPDRMRIIPDKSAKDTNMYIKGYLHVGDSGRTTSLLPEEVVWFRYFNPIHEYAGLAPMAPARLSLDLGRNALKFDSAFFANGALPQDLIFQVDGPVTEDEVEAFYQRLEKRHKGVSNAHRPMLWDLSQGAKPQTLGLNHRDMEFMAALNFTVEDAARIWGVPPPKMYSQTQSIYNNVRQADIEFYTDTISSEWKFLQSEVSELLIPALSRSDEDLYVAFDTSDILPLQEAMAEQQESQRKDITTGIMTINEVRRKRNLPPVSWGDTWWPPISLTPAEGGGAVAPNEESGNRVFALNGYHLYQAKQWTDDVLNAEGVAFTKRLRASEDRFVDMQKALFDRQRRSVLQKLDTITLSAEAVLKQGAGDIFNPDEWVDVFQRNGRPVMAASLTLAAEQHGSTFGIGPFDPSLPEVQRWVDDRVVFWTQQVNESTAQLLQTEIAAALDAGDGIPQVRDRVNKIFRFNNTFGAERIARTEVLAASNQGHLALYRQSGEVQEKMWLATTDDRTRVAHIEAHRQTVPLESKFLVGGEQLDAPGIGGSAGQVINCRCTTAPVIRRRAAMPEGSVNGSTER